MTDNLSSPGKVPPLKLKGGVGVHIQAIDSIHCSYQFSSYISKHGSIYLCDFWWATKAMFFLQIFLLSETTHIFETLEGKKLILQLIIAPYSAVSNHSEIFSISSTYSSQTNPTGYFTEFWTIVYFQILCSFSFSPLCAALMLITSLFK